MDVQLSEEVIEKVDKASQLLGIQQQEIVDRALVVYLDSLTKYLELKEELKAWDALSDEALEMFEKVF